MENKKMPTISVIVPVYNAEKYICRCVESILAQTFDDFEILLVNDGSKDNSGELCNQLAAKDARVKVFHRENHGASAARCFGVQKSCGKYINFVDADDTIPPNSLKDLLGKAMSYKLDMVQGASVYFPSKGQMKYSFLRKEGVITGKDFCTALFHGECYAGPVSSLSKKELFGQETFNLEPIIKVNEDKYMNLCLGTRANRVGLFNDIIVYNYYQNVVSVTQTYNYPSTKPFRLLYMHIKEILLSNGLFSDLREEFLRAELYSALSCCFHNKTLLTDEWCKEVLADTEHVRFPLHLRFPRLMLKYPRLYVLFSVANNIRRCFQ